jgi:ribosomal-protein-alanine N-acetyltransferase
MIYYETARLILREWIDSDLEPFAAMNADSKVMEFFPQVRTAEESQQALQTIKEHFIQHGYGVYAVTDKENNFIGMVGLQVNPDKFSFSPCVEIMWRSLPQYWGNGYAPEAALKCLEIGFQEFNLTEIVSFTAAINLKSQRVMEKIGMQRDFKADFAHPNLTAQHRLNPHVLYRISHDEFEQN